MHLSWAAASAATRPVQLFDALGREVRHQLLPARTRAATLDVAGLAPGLYVVRCGPAASRLRLFYACFSSFRCSSMSAVILLRSKSGCQPQSWRALASSMLAGQELAICWRPSGW